jgi:DNA polymerase-1
MSKKLIVVDISSFIFRAFFAIRPLTSTDGKPVNAVYGVLSMLLKLINQYKPTHIILAKDTPGGSFRNEIYPEYKANRGAPPEELVPQFALIQNLIEKLNLHFIDHERYEADDIIGSVVTQFYSDFDEILIASSDKDLMQFVNGKVKMLDTMKDKIYDREGVKEKMGVYPEQIVDFLSIIGDTSDNIPGVKGVGPVGATKLLAEFKTLEEVLANTDKITAKKLKSSLEENKEKAILSKQLVTINTKIDLCCDASKLHYELKVTDDLLIYLDQLGFKSIQAKLASSANSLAAKRETKLAYEVINTKDELQKLIQFIQKETEVGIEFLSLNEDYHQPDIEAMAVSLKEKHFYVELNSNLVARDCLALFINDEKIKYSFANSKQFWCFAHSLEQSISCNVFDVLQAAFVIHPDAKNVLETLGPEYLDVHLLEKKELSKIDLLTDKKLREHEIVKRSFVVRSLYAKLDEKLKEHKLAKIYYEMDLPLNKILSKMEMRGILLDVEFYKKLEDDFDHELKKIENDIEQIAGEGINLKSPKQVGELLFTKLDLPVIKKTKTGYSTDSDVLEQLASMNVSEIPKHILKYRELEKLQSTYIRSLPKLINEKTKKIHTHFNQNIAATGRLSSDQPNLQNIPIRSENGRLLRKGFVAAPGNVLIGADYSQVELRILAHFSEDEAMLEAFNNDEDIHTQTASEIFEVRLDSVTKDQRSSAKAINFGLMYGQSSFGLAQTLRIPVPDAKLYITNYFKKFSKVKSYLDSLKEFCEKHGYTETLYGRKRNVPDINSQNRQVKSMAERVAINTPIQGTAADIIKVAMLNIAKELEEQKLTSQMILQVHDELIFEVPEDEVSNMSKIIKRNMETAVNLKVPLKVDLAVATNWYELK